GPTIGRVAEEGRHRLRRQDGVQGSATGVRFRPVRQGRFPQRPSGANALATSGNAAGPSRRRGGQMSDPYRIDPDDGFMEVAWGDHPPVRVDVWEANNRLFQVEQDTEGKPAHE